jgi:hypothetical protein
MAASPEVIAPSNTGAGGTGACSASGAATNGQARSRRMRASSASQSRPMPIAEDCASSPAMGSRSPESPVDPEVAGCRGRLPGLNGLGYAEVRAVLDTQGPEAQYRARS